MRQLVPILRATSPDDARDPADDPRAWYYALLDYGAYLKRSVPTPSRRSAAHARQSRFEGSHRQKRAELLRDLLAPRGEPGGLGFDAIVAELASVEETAGRRPIGAPEARGLLAERSAEGCCREEGGAWHV